MKLWLNGTLQDSEQARIDPADRGFLLGDGLFETMVGEGGAVAELALHYARLCAGAALLRLKVPLSQNDLAQAVRQVLVNNGLSNAALRLTLTRGVGPRGVLPALSATPTLLLTAGALPEAAGAARLVTSSIRRDETSPLSQIKSLNYLPNILARLEAAEQGADEALLLNHAGRVAEASAATLFVLRHDGWVTPPVSEGALPGIRRAVLLQAGRVREAPVSETDMAQAEALCLGNALALRSVASLNGQSCARLSTP